MTAVLLVAVLAAANFAYQVARKPTELLSPFGNALNKTPEQTWREYGPLFREFATRAVPSELLAALAQVEGAGNPMAHTYWRWSFTWRPFDIFRPASSAVGMYQMTDAAFVDASRFCVRDHVVVEASGGAGCPFLGYYTRVMPSHAVALTAISLDRQVGAILARLPKAKPTAQQVHTLAAITHLCGAGPGTAYARRGFRLEGERCGDHEAVVYVARVEAMKDRFRRLALRPQ